MVKRQWPQSTGDYRGTEHTVSTLPGLLPEQGANTPAPGVGTVSALSSALRLQRCFLFNTTSTPTVKWVFKDIYTYTMCYKD